MVARDHAAAAGRAQDRPTAPAPAGAPRGGPPPSGGPVPPGASPTGGTSASVDPDPSAPAPGEEQAGRHDERRPGAAVIGGSVPGNAPGAAAPGEEVEADAPGSEVGGSEVGGNEVGGNEVPGGDVADQGQDVEADLERLVEDVERLQGEREELLDQLLRARADFDNYRKRMTRQQAEIAERGAEELVGKLLEVLDVFDAAQVHGQGFEQACSTLAVVLEKEGLARIDPAGAPFDPTEADAVAHVPAGDEQGDGPTVSDVLRAGYRWKGRVLRPAMVRVRG